MHICFSPARGDARPVFRRAGDTLWIDEAAIDLSGATFEAPLTAEEIDNDWIAGPVCRDEAGALHLALRLSHGAKAPQETLFPEAVRVDRDGVIPQPPHSS